MKQTILFLIGSLILCSCSKEWTCNTAVNGQPSSTDIKFEGTTEEAQQYEQDNTFEINNLGTVVTYETTCHVD